MALMRTLIAAGLKRGRRSFVGIFLLMTLTGAALTFTVSMYVDLNAREEAALAEIEAGDVYAVDVAANLNRDVADEIEALPEVSEARLNDALGVPVKYYRGDGTTVDKNPTSGTALVAWGDALDFRLFSEDGRSLVADTPEPGPNEVYVPVSMQVSPGVHKGDELEVIVGDSTRRLSIAGFYEDPQMGSPFIEIKRYLVAERTFDEVAAEVDAATLDGGRQELFSSQGKLASSRMAELNVRLTDEARAAGTTSSDLARIIAEKVAWANTASGMFASDTLVGYAMMVVVIGGAVMGVFALLLFAIALIICTHTVSTSIEEGYADYGTLKALGLPNRALRGMLVVEYAGVSLAGLAVGLTLGSVLVPFALPFFAQLTCVLASNAAPPAAAIALLVVLLALVAAVVALKTGKLARISPLVAFRGGAADVRFRSRGERPLGGSHLSLQLAVRAIMSAKRRYVGLAGCACVLCAFIVLVFGIGGTLRGENAAQDAFGMWESDLSITLASPDVDFAEVERVIEEASPIEKSWQEAFTMVSFGGESHSFAGLSDLTLVQGVTEGCLPAHDNEALIGVNLAKSMDLRVGDELVVDGADGEERRFVVCGLLSAMFNAGSGTILTYDGVRDLAGTAEEAAEPSRQYQLADPGAADEARAAVESRFGDAVDTRSTGMFADTTSMIDLIQQLFTVMGYAMAGVAAALAFLAVSLIIGRMFTAERHDLGVYLALGFTSRALRLQFALRFFLVALVGCALGATAATLGGGWLMGQLFGLFGVSRFAIDTNPLMVGGLTLGLALVFLVAAYASARKVRRVDVRELVAE
ncbi:ABC transporter permease [Gordonibacter pamelaeae]|uniref:ABC transporter permease n=1 Tax=Gordonibacter pamelaeae TaxID=471189 RepID=UPI00242F7C38|nr:ABC transporter permease [Gordonibacter pamelaeae]